MKIGFVCRGYENIGIEYLSAVLKKNNVEVKLYFEPGLFSGNYFLNNRILDKYFNEIDNILDNILTNNIEILGFSAQTVNYKWCLDIAARVKKQKPETIIIFGGVHVTSVPEVVLKNEFIDYICIGECEHIIYPLIENLCNGNLSPVINNVWYKKDNKAIKNEVIPYIEDINNLPFPDKNIFYELDLNFEKEYSIIGGRGCGYKCPYCSHSMFHKNYSDFNFYFRVRRPDNIIEELKRQASQAKRIAFEESNFCVKIDWLDEFAARYKKEINKPFIINLRPDMVNKERIKLLKEAGCDLIYFGIQTANEEIRKKYLNRYDTNEQIKENLKIVKDYGIKFCIDHIFGLPDETEEYQLNSVYFYSEISPYKISGEWLALLPGTEMIEIFYKLKLIDKEFINKINKGIINRSPGTGGTFFLENRNFLKINILMYLIPLLSQKRINWLIRKKIYKIFPNSNFILQIIMLITALKNKDYKIFNYIMYIFKGIKKNILKK